MGEAQEMFEPYMEELIMIQRHYHPTSSKKHLTEAEVFLQCINMSPSVRFFSGRGKSERLHELHQVYASLADWVRSEILASVEGRFQRTAAYFYVGINSARRQKSKQGESFAWLVIPDLFEALRKVEENNFNDGDSVL